MSISLTRSGVGGTIGSPSDQPLVKKRLFSSSTLPLKVNRPAGYAGFISGNLPEGFHWATVKRSAKAFSAFFCISASEIIPIG
ncbi:MAG: hypothetical protein ABSG75_02670 [Syntrophales bacterium]